MLYIFLRVVVGIVARILLQYFHTSIGTLFVCFAGIAYVVVRESYRTKLQVYFGIEHNFCTNLCCVCLFPMCTLCQEAREVKLRKGHFKSCF